MDQIIPWEKLERQLVKKYSKGKIGRKPYPLRVMLRIHVMQLLYNLSDPAMEDVLYEIDQEGSIVDVTIIVAPSSTKNEKGERDPDMHQVKKGKQWHFGMKLHVAVDESLGLTGKRAQLVASPPVSQAEKSKASVRAGVEHCSHRIKCQFGYNKVRYRGLEKNTNLRSEPHRVT